MLCAAAPGRGGDPSGAELTDAMPARPGPVAPGHLTGAGGLMAGPIWSNDGSRGRRHIYQLDRTGWDALRGYLEGLEGLSGFDA